MARSIDFEVSFWYRFVAKTEVRIDFPIVATFERRLRQFFRKISLKIDTRSNSCVSIVSRIVTLSYTSFDTYDTLEMNPTFTISRWIILTCLTTGNRFIYSWRNIIAHTIARNKIWCKEGVREKRSYGVDRRKLDSEDVKLIGLLFSVVVACWTSGLLCSLTAGSPFYTVRRGGVLVVFVRLTRHNITTRYHPHCLRVRTLLISCPRLS